jgi:two-component system, OmpR family, sensor histidine kinase KdpD
MEQGDGWRVAPARLAHSVGRALWGTIGVTLLTAVCHRLHANLAITGFLLLLIVLLQSLAGDFPAAILVCLGAVSCLDFFFTDPLYTFKVARGMDVVALISFVATALVITALVRRARAEAKSARLERERTVCLYRLAQQLLATKPEATGSTQFLELFVGVFGSTAVCLFDAETAELHVAGSPRRGLESRTRDAYVSGRDMDDPESGTAARRLTIGGRTIGAIGFEHLENPEATGGPLAMLAATIVARTHALRQASESAAAAQTEVYRSAVLDALAHEFKTPLATILTAVGGLPEAGHLNTEQVDLIEMVEGEAERLGGLTSRLLRMARLDREEVRPRMEALDLNSVLAQIVTQQARQSPDRRLQFSPQASALEASIDPELFRLAISQLLENACKYSQPGSRVEVTLEQESEFVAIRVSNDGSFISARDQPRIFDRFYRGTDTNVLAPGSGLGLYVARKIAAAHGGSLTLETNPDAYVTFRFTLPRHTNEIDHAVTINQGISRR